ncbi:hypothetical protein A7K50_04180 [Dehalobacter sp. MCB1]|nr:hypothetical protein A7K50_04180 [Dehalobacter sp. MCB1]
MSWGRHTLKKQINKLFCLGLILVMLPVMSSCAQKSQGKTTANNMFTGNQTQGTEITDPAELEKLWQEYIYDAIYTIGNTWEFHSAQEIDPDAVAQFCWLKYQEENGTANLKTESKESMLLLFPLTDALKYADRYFNLTTLDVSKIPDHDYKPEKQVFTFPENLQKPKPGYAEVNGWGIELDKAVRNRDGTLTVTLEHNYSSTNHFVDSRQTFTLKTRADGSLYFVDGRREYINNHQVALTGNVKEFQEIEGFTGDLQELTMVGETEGKMLLAYTPYNKDQSSALMVLDPDEMKIEKSVKLSGSIANTDVKYTGGKWFVRFNDKVMLYSRDLELLREIPLPATITAKINREVKYDQDGMPDIYFGGYDLSADLKRIVYTDEIGVKLVTLGDGKERLLAKTTKPNPSEPSRGAPVTPSYHFSPRFVDDDRKVITTLTGYECTRGFTFCDLDKGTNTTVDIVTEGSPTTGSIHFDTGLLFVNEYGHDASAGDSQQADGYRTLYLDFHTGKVTEIKLAQPGDTGYIRSDYQSYLGQDFAVFVTSKQTGTDSVNAIHFLNRIRLETLKPEQQIVSVTATDPHILGVLGDGRIVFWYQFNPAEKGICVTSSSKENRQ